MSIRRRLECNCRPIGINGNASDYLLQIPGSQVSDKLLSVVAVWCAVSCLVCLVFAFGMRQYWSLIECHSLMLMLSGAFVVSVVRQLIELRKVELITQSDITCGFAIY